jgi:hypothetical protein
MRPHLEILKSGQRNVLLRLGPILTAGHFFLVGGTAVALHLGHRRSVDLDWFSQKRLGDPLRLAQKISIPGMPLTQKKIGPGTLHARLGAVRVSMLEYRYPLLKRLVHWPAAKIKVASLPDLAAMKLAAIAQRGAKKDFVDLFALLQNGYSLPEMLRGYQKKYSIPDILHLLYSLAYFDDADRERMPAMIWKIKWPDIKTTLQQSIRGI